MQDLRMSRGEVSLLREPCSRHNKLLQLSPLPKVTQPECNGLEWRHSKVEIGVALVPEPD